MRVNVKSRNSAVASLVSLASSPSETREPAMLGASQP